MSVAFTLELRKQAARWPFIVSVALWLAVH